MSKHWKANTGTSMLEKIPLSDKYRRWMNACSEIFGGLDILAIKAVHGRNGRDYILSVSLSK